MCLYSLISGFSLDICCLFILSVDAQEICHKGEFSLQPSRGWCGESSKECFLREIPASRSARGTKYNVEQPRANDYQDQVQVAQSTAFGWKPRKCSSMGPLFGILCLASSPVSSVFGLWFFTILCRL